MTRILKIQFIRKIIQVFKTFFFPTFHGVCIAAPQKHQRKTYVYTPPPYTLLPLVCFLVIYLIFFMLVLQLFIKCLQLSILHSTDTKQNTELKFRVLNYVTVFCKYF